MCLLAAHRSRAGESQPAQKPATGYCGGSWAKVISIQEVKIITEVIVLYNDRHAHTLQSTVVNNSIF